MDDSDRTIQPSQYHAAAELAMQGARASATMMLTYFPEIFPTLRGEV